MTKNYTTVFIILFALISQAQVETLTFNNYDGSVTSIAATTATVNDEITIVFEDADIFNDLYTEGRSFLYIFGGLETSSGTFQGAPGFFNNASQPIANIIATDTDTNVGPNTYTITLNLTAQYSSVPDGEMVTGFNLIFRNEFSAGGDPNNQTVDLFIDLVDAIKDSSVLSATDFEINTSEILTHTNNKELSIESNSKINNVSIYSILGKSVYNKTYNNQNSVSINLDSQSTGIYIVRINSDNKTITKKIVLK